MKTIKFLSGAMLFVLLLGGIVFFMYPTIKVSILICNYIWLNKMFEDYFWFSMYFMLCPFFGYIIGFISYPINEWYKEKMKNLK